MPELPEVETIKRQLNEVVLDRKIKSISTSHLNLHGKPIPNLKILVGESFISIHRRNKYLILESENKYLIIHLGMTGQLIYTDKIPDNIKHVHVIFKFSSSFLYYQDVRRFGSMNLYTKKDYPNYLDIPLFSKLGYEPLSKDFSLKNLEDCIISSSQKAKIFIMNGNFICGLGNIYACEVLFLSKINPEQVINTITKKQKEDLFKHIISVLYQAIEMGGSTISDFVHVNGNSGKMQDYYFVYGRENQTCKICNHIVKKIKQNGRSTFYCPHCQK